MKFLKSDLSRKRLLRHKAGILNQDQQPPSYPCYAYFEVASFGHEQEYIRFLTKKNIVSMAIKFKVRVSV
jgi:hypothetical protein